LEINYLDNINQVTPNNREHTGMLGDVIFKVEVIKEDVQIGTNNKLDQAPEIIIIVANQVIGPRSVRRKKVT